MNLDKRTTEQKRKIAQRAIDAFVDHGVPFDIYAQEIGITPSLLGKWMRGRFSDDCFGDREEAEYRYARLTDAEIDEIYDAIKDGYTHEEIAQAFGLLREHIEDLINGY